MVIFSAVPAGPTSRNPAYRQNGFTYREKKAVRFWPDNFFYQTLKTVRKSVKRRPRSFDAFRSSDSGALLKLELVFFR